MKVVDKKQKDDQDIQHSTIENITALITGCGFVALGVLFLQTSGLAAGGVTGLALVIENITKISFSILFLLINLPFFILAWMRMGKGFAMASFIGATLVSILNGILRSNINIEISSPCLSAILGGFLMGVGMLILFRHQCSIGGFNILAIFFQEKGIISAGKIQLILDISVLTFLGFSVDVAVILPTAISVIVLNVVLIMNHKNARYLVTYTRR